jgi:hypothetical protein
LESLKPNFTSSIKIIQTQLHIVHRKISNKIDIMGLKRGQKEKEHGRATLKSRQYNDDAMFNGRTRSSWDGYDIGSGLSSRSRRSSDLDVIPYRGKEPDYALPPRGAQHCSASSDLHSFDRKTCGNPPFPADMRHSPPHWKAYDKVVAHAKKHRYLESPHAPGWKPQDTEPFAVLWDYHYQCNSTMALI